MLNLLRLETKGVVSFCVSFCGILQIYELRVLETKPAAAVSIIECDMNVSCIFCVYSRLQRELQLSDIKFAVRIISMPCEYYDCT